MFALAYRHFDGSLSLAEIVVGEVNLATFTEYQDCAFIITYLLYLKILGCRLSFKKRLVF